VDAAYQALTATAKPLRRTLTGGVDEGTGHVLRLASAARNYSRNLAADTARAGPLDAATWPDIELSSAALKHSMDAVAGALTGTRDGVYTRSSALFDQAERRIEERSGIAHPAQLAIRDLMLIDGTMAQIAERLGLPVTDYDTVPRGPTNPASPGGARIRGRVHAPHGGGIRATLTLINPRGRQAGRTVAGPDGGYRLDAPAPGAYTLLASAASRHPTASTVILRHPGNGGETAADMLLSGAGAGALAGAVTAADSGHPVAGARVTITSARGVVAGTRLTGPDGGYEFNELEDGDYTMTASAGLYHPVTRSIVRSDGEHVRADVGVASEARLSGIVVTKDGTRPVPDARITLLDTTGAVVAVAYTDEAGRYVTEALPDGEYTAITSGYPPAASTLHVTGQERTVRHDIELRHPQQARVTTSTTALARSELMTCFPSAPDVAAAMAYLDGLINYEQTGRMERPTIERMARLITALGNPQRAYPAIHLTGTNGKGSTAAMITSLLRGQGLKAGTYTSPHVTRLAERITIDGRPVGNDDLAGAIGRVRQAARRAGVTPTWFEVLTAAGLWLLAAASVEVAVIEVGMLGRWDATNVVDGTVAVVTNVQLDHTDVAGPTRAAIAAEKAGIIKPGSTLVLGEQDPGLRPIFAAQHPARVLAAGQDMSWRNRRSSPAGSLVDLVNPWGPRAGIEVGMIGPHQCDNALLALTAAEAFTGTRISGSSANAALSRVHVPGRFEIVSSNPLVVLDGAHNPAGAAALRRAVEENFAAVSPRILLCGTLTGRDPIEFLDQVGVRSADLVIATEPASPAGHGGRCPRRGGPRLRGACHTR
jgi:dihydrofolate synthase/folylpolyglutamate synthase